MTLYKVYSALLGVATIFTLSCCSDAISTNKEMSPESVVDFSRNLSQKDSGYPPYSDIYMSHEMCYVLNNLQHIMNSSAYREAKDSFVLDFMVWKAAVNVADETVLTEVVGILLSRQGREIFGVIAEDLASGYRNNLSSRYLLISDATDSDLDHFALLLTEGDPGDWGSRDYEPILQALAFDNRYKERGENLKLYAAFALAKWRPEQFRGRAIQEVLSPESHRGSLVAQDLMRQLDEAF